jgi:hypothetical protein
MKKHLVANLIFALLLVPLLGFANGLYTPGTVTVNGAGSTLTADYNVRYNPAVNKGSISITAGYGIVAVYAQTSDTGVNWSCTIEQSNTAIYPTAVNAAMSAGNGTRLIVVKNSVGQCTNINFIPASARLD